MKHRVFWSRAALLGLVSALGLAAAVTSAEAANKVLKIGFVGVTSGPAAAWGTSNVRSMQTLAAWWNERGGVKIGDQAARRHNEPDDTSEAGNNGADRRARRRRPEHRLVRPER